MNTKTFCIAPWTHTCVTPVGKLTPCCLWQGPSDYLFTEYDSWINSQELKDTRQALHNGDKISSCSQCWNNEDVGKKSLRQIYNKEFSKYFQFSSLNDQWTVDNGVSTFDFKLGNLCNLKCVMCDGNLSSQLMSEYKTYTDKFTNLDFFKTPSINTDFSWPETTEFKEFLNKFKDQIRWIKFTGGEPTINPYIIKLLKEIPNPNLVTVSLTTNGTKINKELLEILSKFNKLWISVSVDGVEDSNDQIRYLSSWHKVSTTAITLSKLPNVYFNINYIFQCFSVTTLIPLLKWCDIYNLKIEMIVLYNPNYLTINSIEPTIITKFKNQLTQLTSATNQHIIEQAVNLLNLHSYDPNLETQRINYLSTLDEIRGSNTRNLI